MWGTQLRRGEGGRIENYEVVKPIAHIFYGTRVVDVVDGLGKWEGYESISEKFDLK